MTPLMLASLSSRRRRVGPSSGGGGGSSALATLAASMSSGDWQSFTMGGMDLSLLDSGGGRSITEFSARGHWDPVHKVIQYWGQGHYQTPALVTWDDATNQWSKTQNVPYVFTGTEAGHAYYHLALNPANGDLYLRGFGSGVIYKKPYGGSWTTAASHANLYNQVAGGLEWFPALNSGAGGLVFIDVGSAQSSNAAVSSWTTRQDPLSPNLGNYHNWIARAGSTMYFGGGLGSTTMFSMNSSGTVSSAPSTPIAGGVGEGIVMSHPNGSDLLMFAQGTTGNIYRFSSGSWSGSIGTHQIGGGTNLWFGVPVSDYGVVVFVAQTSNVSEPTVKVYKP